MNGEHERMARNRKAIKKAQQKEMLYVGYYVFFIVEYIVKLILWKPSNEDTVVPYVKINAFVETYDNISFVQERRRRQKFSSHVRDRKPFYWKKYL